MEHLCASLPLQKQHQYYDQRTAEYNFESTIDKFDALLQPLNHFIIPGDTVAAAALDIARTTTRRAERCLLRLAETEEVNPNVLICLNRLSDLCFILGRVESEVK